MYDTLLFFHLLAAFTLATAVVLLTAYTLGAPTSAGGFTWAGRLEDMSATATLVFGVWLALYVDAYSITDGWIVAAIVLWAAAGASSNFFRQRVQSAGAAAGAEFTAVVQRAATLSWVRTALFVLLLADMAWKPGA